ncbi:hypothetical protein Acy02nite_81620 [Actinoplanes cyaneus]|uniref:HTH cro/C1-type domain-containing protein n=1 Tax=Actinoplanes cyaneus TaxID=52696 RepID=A0A919MGI7_9ACTN|nr:helix-turn-helix domain-containing protein [Actinoplanes cyaneus]MCW2143431.1 Transcriptional regulator, contains XRE-family HTH domain [Actinoplanes cyaneus]GID70281.1 hypothetical protein Acy02nite_81620 [Actinoplanes cyaneus]
MAEDRTFGALLRQFRLAGDLTLPQLAAASGISDRAISDLERGVSRNPRARTVEALADGLGLGSDDRAALRAAARPVAGLVVASGLPLPRPVLDFTGRSAEQDRLARWAADRPSPPVVISGAPGIGKTALAVRAARACPADRYFFIDLHGLDVAPPDPMTVLRRLLRAAVPGLRAVPGTVAEAAALWHARIREQRCVVILDNAAAESQIRPILPPGEGPAVVLITSRRALSGLDGVRRLFLDALPADDAAALLAAVIEDHDAASDDDVRRIAQLCGNLPLALRIAGNRLLSRPGWTPRDLLGRLVAAERRLDSLVAGDLELKAAFHLSYRQTSGRARRVLHRLATTGEPGLTLARERTAVDELVELSLVRRRPDGGLEIPELLRLYAGAELVHAQRNFMSPSWCGFPPW